MSEVLKDLKKQLEQKKTNELEIKKIEVDNIQLNDKLNLLDRELSILEEENQNYKEYKESLKTIKKIMLIIIVCGILCGVALSSIAYFIKGIDLIPCIMSGGLFSFTGLVLASVFMPNYSEIKEYLETHDIKEIEEKIKQKEKEKKEVNEKVKTNESRKSNLKLETKKIDTNVNNQLTPKPLTNNEELKKENQKQKKIGTKK